MAAGSPLPSLSSSSPPPPLHHLPPLPTHLPCTDVPDFPNIGEDDVVLPFVQHPPPLRQRRVHPRVLHKVFNQYIQTAEVCRLRCNHFKHCLRARGINQFIQNIYWYFVLTRTCTISGEQEAQSTHIAQLSPYNIKEFKI